MDEISVDASKTPDARRKPMTYSRVCLINMPTNENHDIKPYINNIPTTQAVIVLLYEEF
jgi:hypothetical protein